MRVLRLYTRIPLGTRLVAAFLMGAAAGLVLGPRAAALSPLARLLTDTLRLLAPVVVAAFVLGGLSSRDPRRVGRVAGLALGWFLGLALLASAIGALAVVLVRPVGEMPLALDPPAGAPGWWASLRGWTPASGLETIVPLVFLVTVPLALAIGAWREARPDGPAARLHSAASALAGVVMRALTVLLEYAPIGAFASAAVMFAQAGGSAGTQLALVIVTVYAAHAALGGSLLFLAAAMRIAPVALLRDSREALVTAIATGSSAATLPVELRVAEGILAVPAPAARTVMPLGTTFSKAGTTAFLSALGVVGGYVSGHEVTPVWIASVVGWSALAGIATPPVSGGGFVMLALVFGQTGVSLAWVPVLTTLPLIGKLNTPLNALGRLIVAATVGRS